MSGDVVRGDHRVWTSFAARICGFWAIWVLMIGVAPVDLLVGVVAAAVAAKASMKLLPPGAVRISLSGTATLVVRFLRQSIVAGIDVARRALDPHLPIAPGFVQYKSDLPAGAACDAFCTMTSLLPGTLPSGEGPAGEVSVHCLDTRQPVPQQLAAEEALFVRAFLGGRP